jgi:hypothetical protein
MLSIPQKAEFNWTLGDPEKGANKALKLWWKYGEDGDEMFEQWFENGGRKAVLLPKDGKCLFRSVDSVLHPTLLFCVCIQTDPKPRISVLCL